ncbi:MAG: glutamate racemase [Bacteroidales bacterium]|nr:glutamate racemase [Bacteroidales bacterium]MCF8454407.1 glutamate racemase [Bacteroidales bacterium]
MLKANQAIGIFDSGVGGLTVASAVKNLLPQENMIYFGDTAHLPYGDKSTEAIRYYSEKIAAFLLEKNCKVILIACNTASAQAFEIVQQVAGDKVKVFNVIDPVVDFITASRKYHKIGVIGTKGTINSGTYARKILERKPEARVISLATPLLAPMIEEGFIYDDISNAIIRSYLSNEQLAGITSLILGCTHYPIIKNQIRKYYNFNVKVIDSGQIVANQIKQYLQANNLLNDIVDPHYQFYVSDYTDLFEKISEMFFEEEVHLEMVDLWK